MGLDPQGTSRRTFGRSDVRMDGKFTPLSYRTSSPSGPLPKRKKCVSNIAAIISRAENAGDSLSAGPIEHDSGDIMSCGCCYYYEDDEEYYKRNGTSADSTQNQTVSLARILVLVIFKACLCNRQNRLYYKDRQNIFFWHSLLSG